MALKKVQNYIDYVSNYCYIIGTNKQTMRYKMTNTIELTNFTSTLVDQLCGGKIGRLQVMLGAHNFMHRKNDKGNFIFCFYFKGSHKASAVRFELNGLDLYNVTFFKKSKGLYKEVGEFENLYNDMLKSTFENFTGLYLSL
jgi:hypothetical protein